MGRQDDRFQRLQRASNRHACHRAIHLGSRYCRRYPAHSPAWLFFGRALAEAARYGEARDALHRGLACSPEDRRSVFYSQLGHMEAAGGDFSAAESWYQRAFDAAAVDSEERLYLGEIRYRQGRLRDAEAAIRPVTEVWNESLGEAFHLLGEILAAQNRFVEALDAFRTAADHAPDRRKHASRVRELERLVNGNR